MQIVNFQTKVLLSSFHLNDYTLGFHPLNQNGEPPCTVLVLLTAPQEGIAL